MEFKLLAFQIIKESIYTKNLRKEVLYQFTHEYEFIYESNKSGAGNCVEIKKVNSYPQDLYDFKGPNGISQVHVTAILGRNGAGKSTLLELIYLLLYCISERKRYLNDRATNSKFIERNYLVDYHEQLNKKINEILNKSQMELYYRIDNDYYSISNSGKQINFRKLIDRKWVSEEFEKDKLFYTISSNYSLYGLNSKGNYFWLNGLFHKNDGYKTPLVITPWRDQGNININTELHLAQTRILANLVTESFESDIIIDDKVVTSIDFKIVPDNVGKVGPFSIGFIYVNSKKRHNVDLIELFRTLITSYDPAVTPQLDDVLEYLKGELSSEIENDKSSNSFAEYNFTNPRPIDRHLIRCLLAKYIVSKIAKICINYSDFQKFTTFWPYEENKIGNTLLISSVSNLPQKIKRDQTHITLKLKQAINAFLFNYLENSKWSKERNPESLERVIYTTTLNFADFQEMIKKAYKKSRLKSKSVVQFIPTGFYLPNIFVESRGGRFSFGQLSSGEQQMVHAIHSIIYHILNLDSLSGTKNPYKAVNLILDEIELYYHPEYQRLFIKRLLESLSKLNLKSILGFNIIFSTHSPFILSDIPHRNVLKLRNGLPDPFDDEAKTFGANIHEMLTDSFFLDQKLIGAFAEQQVKGCLEKLRLLELGRQRLNLFELNDNDPTKPGRIKAINIEINRLSFKNGELRYEEELSKEIETEKILKTINIIGEPIVKFKMREMYDEILQIDDAVKAKAKRQIQEIMERSGIKKNEL